MNAGRKGLSIGAAMKQRMGQEQEDHPAAVQPERKKERKEEREISSIEAVASPGVDADPLESFNTRLPRSLLRRLKVHAASNGTKIQDVLRQALESHLEQQEK